LIVYIYLYNRLHT